MMMEQTDIPTSPGVPVVSIKLALSDEVRASLEAVRVAQEAARTRARRQTVRARIWLALSAAAIALVVVAVGPRVLRGRHARPQPAAATSAARSPIAPAATAPVAMAPQAPAPSGAVAAMTEAPAAPAIEADSPTPAKARGAVGAAEDCDTALVRSAPWRISPDACARAFEADPGNADLALAIAHAEHVRGRFADAAQWANRALALDPKAAEAYVLIARAAVAGGHDEDARAAYGRYLEIAPRGWHQAEARRAGRGPRAR